MPFIFKCFHTVQSVVFSCTDHMESFVFFFSAYLLIPSKELLAKSITPLVGLVTTPTKPLPIPEKGDSQVKLRFCKKQEWWQDIFTSVPWESGKHFHKQIINFKVVFNDSNIKSVRTFEETFHTFLLSALYWLTDNSCNSIKNSLSKTTFSYR